MSKVFLVFSYWRYKGCPDDFTNCYEDHILKTFDNEEKAIAYIRNEIPRAGEIKEKIHIVDNVTKYEEDGMFYIGLNVE